MIWNKSKKWCSVRRLAHLETIRPASFTINYTQYFVDLRGPGGSFHLPAKKMIPPRKRSCSRQIKFPASFFPPINREIISIVKEIPKFDNNSELQGLMG